MSYHRFVLLLLLAFILTGNVTGQSFEDFQKQIDTDYRKFEQDIHDQFDAFVQQIDREFADFLKKSFQEFDVVAGVQTQSGPKPDQPPGYSAANKPGLKQKISINAPAPSVAGAPRMPNIRKSEPAVFEQMEANFDFFGAGIKLRYDSRLKTTAINEVSPAAISEYWNSLSETNYNHLIRQFEDYRTQLNLNDWAYYKLVEAFASTLYPSAPSLRNLISWFLLTRSRFKVKIGFSENRAYLLIPSAQNIYGTNFLMSDGHRFYMTEATSATIHTYKGDFPEADIIPDLTISSPLNLPQNIVTKTVSFAHEGKKMEFKVPFNKNIMRFYETIPLTEPAVYFNSALWSGTKDAFRESMLPQIAGKSQQEAVSILLSLVQHGFSYKTDEEQFGFEKYMFAEELLYYPHADCEDRAVLFSLLVRELIGLETVGLAFDGHMAAAVCFEDEVAGTSFNYNNCNYTVADPTFIGAPVGILMPQAIGQKPEIIPIRASHGREEQVWSRARKSGGLKADKLRDVVFDSEGNAYVCGYLVDRAGFGEYVLNATNPSKNAFVASYDAAGNVRWARAFSGNADNLAYSLSVGPEGDLMLAGTFKGQLQFAGGIMEASPNADVFVARISPDGQLKWAVKAGIDKLNQEAGFMFSAAFDAQGEKILAKLYEETEDFKNFGLQLDAQGNTFVTGAFYATSGMNINKGKGFDTAAGFNPVNSLKAENDALIQEQYEKTIAGMFAAMKLIQINSLELPGKDVQQVFDKHNPGFVKIAPKFYASFGGLRFMKNAGGIITIKTADGKPVVFDKIVINDNARIKVVTYKSGNARIEVFSGIDISNGSLKLPLNELKLFKENGDLQLGYDTDNTQVKLNLRKDMLKL
ncbi:MAG: hypothetical protein Q8S18_01140 [Bacteroidales bacterium]|nr:hypothetical protein [Bacteroidales bacterium]